VLDVASSSKANSRHGDRNAKGRLEKLESALKSWQTMLEVQASKEEKRSRKKTKTWQQAYVKAAKADVQGLSDD
jgi:hypothetical protein